MTKRKKKLVKTPDNPNTNPYHGTKSMPQAPIIVQDSPSSGEFEKKDLDILKNDYEELKNEIKLIKENLISNAMKEAEQTQKLIKSCNELQNRIDNHDNNKTLNKLGESLVKSLRSHFESLIPLSSGLYKPDGKSVVTYEIAHESTHLLEFFLHHMPKLTEVTGKVSHVVSELVPFLGMGVKLLELWNAHHLIHQAEHAVKSIKGYSDNERTAIYKYVINSALLALASSIKDGAPTKHKGANLYRKAGDSLNQWHVLLFAESISESLHMDTVDDIHALASHWAASLIKQFEPKQEMTIPQDTLEIINEQWPDSYRSMTKHTSDVMEQARILLDDYTKGGSAFWRTIYGHWNRHYIEEVTETIKKIDDGKINNLDALMARFKKKVTIENESGSLSRRLGFLAHNAKEIKSQELKDVNLSL